MQSKYIYAGTYSSLLINQLLTTTQRDLLLATTTPAEVEKVLQDTCFAPFLTPASTLNESLDAFVVAQKDRLRAITPNQPALDILFLQYDYANAKLILQASQEKEAEETVLAKCSPLGTIAPQKLYQAITTEQLHLLTPALMLALQKAIVRTQRSLSDILDQAYLEHIQTIAATLHDEFISKHVTTIVDLYNIQSRLRSYVHTASEAVIVQSELVAGGSLQSYHLETLESILAVLPRFGGKSMWQEAIAQFTESHDFSSIDRAADNYIAQFLKQATIDIHSSAPLFAYFMSVLDHTQFVRSVVAAHNVGLSEVELRSLVRNSIHDYAY